MPRVEIKLTRSWRRKKELERGQKYGGAEIRKMWTEVREN